MLANGRNTVIFKIAGSPFTTICSKRRQLCVYALGEGWTGALGAGDLHQTSPDDGMGVVKIAIPTSTRTNRHTVNTSHSSVAAEACTGEPIVLAVSAGWGHTALVVQDDVNDRGSTRLLVCGRPHDFRTLLRLKRFPKFVRNFVVRYSLQHTYEASRMDALSQGKNSLPFNKDAFVRGEEIGAFSLSSFLNSFGRENQFSQSCLLPNLHDIILPNNDVPALPTSPQSNSINKVLDASAGFTAVVGQSGSSLYTFGLNPYGQCGVGYDSNNVWAPTAVRGLSTQFASGVAGRMELLQEHSIVNVSLGLQHASAVDSAGNVFSWGKGERSQLGTGGNINSPCGLLVAVQLPSNNNEGKPQQLLKAMKVACGYNHTAITTEHNYVFVWGKNATRKDDGKIGDLRRPTPVRGLPPNLLVEDISCGSHHTAILMEDGSVWAVGIATDNGEPLLGEAVMMLEPGRVELPLRQLTSAFDRTIVVSRDGKSVYEMSLWSHEDLRRDATAVQQPDWLERIRQADGDVKVKFVAMGWLHTVIVTDDAE